MENPAASLAVPASWTQTSSPRQIEYLTQCAEALTKALATGSIPNARFLEATESINRAIDRAWSAAGDALRQPYHNGRSPYPESVDAMFYTHPTLATFARVEKKLATLPPHPLTTAWTRVMTDAKPLADAWAKAKPLAVKRQVRTEEERNAERFTPPPITSQAQVRVQALLEESVNASYEDLCTLLRNSRRRMLDGFLDMARRAETDLELRDRWKNTYSIGWHFDRRNTHSRDRGDSVGAGELSSWVVAPDHGKTTWKAKRNVDALIEVAARKHADELRKLFVVKNLRKIASILEAKGDERFDEAEIIGMPVNIQAWEGSFRFSFKDGSSFRVNNAIVFARSPLGTPFHRFPLTFHDVVLPSGEPMPQPSEERMNTVFSQENGPVPAPVARRRPGP